MADELLDANQDVVVDDVVAAEEAPSEVVEQLTQTEVLAMIEDVKVEAKREAKAQAEDAFRRSQSKIDQDIARQQQTTATQVETLMTQYGAALAEHGADADTIEGLQRQTQASITRSQEHQELTSLRQYKADAEANLEIEKQIQEVLSRYKIDRSHPELNFDSQTAFYDSVYVIRDGRLERRLKDAERSDKKQDLEALREAGGLDVTGGGAAMASPAWSTDKLVAGSEESVIAGHVVHFFKNLTVEQLGQKILKVQQLMKLEPRLAPKDAARRVWDMEAGR